MLKALCSAVCQELVQKWQRLDFPPIYSKRMINIWKVKRNLSTYSQAPLFRSPSLIFRHGTHSIGRMWLLNLQSPSIYLFISNMRSVLMVCDAQCEWMRGEGRCEVNDLAKDEPHAECYDKCVVNGLWSLYGKKGTFHIWPLYVFRLSSCAVLPQRCFDSDPKAHRWPSFRHQRTWP